MHTLAANAVTVGPLARAPLLESIRNALTSGPQANETMIFLVGLIAFVLLIMLAARFFSREAGPPKESQVDYLTLSVDVLGLSESDRRDLQRIAHRAGLEQPAAMLLSPANLAHAAAATLSVENDSGLRERLDRLCLRLFDVPLPPPG
jgi:hypothetical protein